MIKRLAQQSGFDTFKTNRADTECSFPTSTTPVLETSAYLMP